MKCSRGFWIFLWLVLLCFLVVPLRVSVFRIHVPAKFARQLFHNFTQKYNRNYSSSEEYQHRLGVFTVSTYIHRIKFSLETNSFEK